MSAVCMLTPSKWRWCRCVCCVYADTIQVEVVPLCLLFALYFMQISTNSFINVLYFNIDLKCIYNLTFYVCELSYFDVLPFKNTA